MTDTHYPSNRIVRFERWIECYICGVPWPESMLKKQRGNLVCPDDVDGKSHTEYVRDSEVAGEEPREVPWTPDGDES